MKRFLTILVCLCLILSGCGALEQLTPQGQSAPVSTGPMPDLQSIPHKDLRLHLNTLDPSLYANACTIYEAAMAFAPDCSFHYPMQAQELTRLITLVHHECPELFQLDLSASVTYTLSDDKVISMKLPYIMDRAAYEDAMDRCSQAVSALLEACRDLDHAQKERRVYDFITENCTYSTEGKHAGSIYGCLVEKSAKCDGISLTMKWILEQLEVSCLLLSGEPVKGEVGHAWNLVCLDGQYYDVDVTADVRRSDESLAAMYPAYNTDTLWIRSLYILDSAYTQTPGYPAMDRSFHALEGNFIPQGQTPQLETLFMEAYNTQGSFTLQFADPDGYTAFCQSLEEEIAAIARAKGLPGYAWQCVTTDEYRCVRVSVSQY